MNKKLLAYILIPFAGVAVATASGIAVGFLPSLTQKDNELEERIENLEKQVEELQEQIDSLKEDLEEECSAIREDHTSQINDLDTKIKELQTELSNLAKKHDEDKKAIYDKYNEEISNLTSDMEEQKQELETKLADEISKLDEEYEEKVNDINSQITDLTNDIIDLENEMNQKIKELQDDYNSKINDLITRINALETVTYHTVSYNTNGGSWIPESHVQHGEKINKPDDPSKNGYTFEGWTCQGEAWSFIGYVVTEDILLDANWSMTNYTINFNLDGGTLNGSSNPTPWAYNIESSITLTDPVKEGYSFAGWKDQNGNYVTRIESGTYGDIELTATWEVGYYYFEFVTFTDGGSIEGTMGYYAFGSSVTVTAVPDDGYKFAGWYESNGTFVSSSTTYTFSMPGHYYDLVAKFEENITNVNDAVSEGISSISQDLQTYYPDNYSDAIAAIPSSLPNASCNNFLVTAGVSTAGYNVVGIYTANIVIEFQNGNDAASVYAEAIKVSTGLNYIEDDGSYTFTIYNPDDYSGYGTLEVYENTQTRLVTLNFYLQFSPDISM